jgi:hypothetical protein
MMADLVGLVLFLVFAGVVFGVLKLWDLLVGWVERVDRD